MISATKSGTTTSYVQNALGQRVKKSNLASTTYFVYDEAGHLVGEYDGSGILVQEIVWFGDTPVASLKPNGASVDVFYIHTDHLNTPRKITRPSDNAIVWTWHSDPFGTTAANQNPSGLGTFAFNLRFPGQYYDSETGLHYNYYRDGYDSAVGRYTQSDPIGLRGGVNTYAYVLSNPLSFSDPLGLDGQMCRAALTIAGGIVGGGAGYACGCVAGGLAGGVGGSLVPVVGTAAGAAAGCGGVGPASGALGAALGAAAGTAVADAVCKEDESNCSKASSWQLIQAGITDAHAFKTDYGAIPNSRFDICACKDGSIVIKATGGCGKPGPSIGTHANWKK
ncbi:MAG TPA: RHS repeat-associated core domain-containing protein [Steroidobacteraceae bacterium]|nr:RHS repeat-associated core domain-containing protein [Steroidobacteraceae bacterium]